MKKNTLLIVFSLVVVAIFGITVFLMSWFRADIRVKKEDVVKLPQRAVESFYPKSLGSYEISPISNYDDFRLLEASITEVYDDKDAEDKIVALLDKMYQGSYKNEKDKREIVVSLYQLKTKEDAQKLEQINKKAFLSTGKGFEEYAYKIDNAQTIFIYRDIYSFAQEYTQSAAVAVIFVDEAIAFQFEFKGNYKLQEVKEVIKEYITSVISNSEKTISSDDILTKSKKLEIDTENLKETFENVFDEKKKEAEDNYRDVVDEMRKDFEENVNNLGDL